MTYTKNTLRRVLIVLGAMTLLTAAACRNWKHKSPEERAEWVTKKITKELELNESQKQTLAAIKTDLLAKHAAEKAERDNQLRQFTELMRKDTIDQAKLAELKKKHQQMRDRAEEQFLAKIVEFHKVLTPEQRNKSADLLQKHMSRFMGEK